MANPAVSPGVLNLLLTSIVIPSYPSLNVTPSFMGEPMIRFALEGEMTRHLPAAVGVVVSPQVYMIGTVTLALLKSQNLSAQYKAQWESNTVLGNIVVRTDSSVLPAFDLSQVGIVDMREMSFNGREPDMMVTLRGQYYINASLWP